MMTGSITSPTLITSRGWWNRLLDNSLRWIRPLVFRPISTKTPKSTTFWTVPLTTLPISKSLSFATFLRVSGAGASSRGSRPGRARASRISVTVGRPAFSLTAMAEASALAAASWTAMSLQCFRSKPSSARICSAKV